MSVRFTNNAAFTLGPMMAFVTNRRGTSRCASDACDVWAVAGDTVFVVKVGFGAAF